MEIKNNWYVYRHIRLDKNEPFYIGIGCKPNFFRAYEKGNKRSLFWNKITSKTDYDIEILFENLTKENASEKEKEFIQLYGRKDLNSGTLVNMTSGGDGLYKAIYTKETRDKIRSKKIGCLNPMFGKKQSKETLEKRSKSLKGLTKSNITKEKQSIASIKSGQAKKIKVYMHSDKSFIGEFHSIAWACKKLSLAFNTKVSDSKACLVAKGIRSNHKNFLFVYSQEVS